MITGIGELFEKTRLLLISSLVLPLVPLLQNVLGQEWIPPQLCIDRCPLLLHCHQSYSYPYQMEIGPEAIGHWMDHDLLVKRGPDPRPGGSGLCLLHVNIR